MYQFLSKPDWWISRCGDLRFFVRERRIPAASDVPRGLRAVFLSDTHVIARTTDAQIDAFAARVAALKPDILWLGGDYADEAGDARRLFRGFRAIRPPLGAFAVAGNNDREAWPELTALEAALADSGVTLLVNAARALPVGDGRLIVAGVDDHLYGQPSADGLYPEPAPGLYRVLLSHFPVPPENLPDLILSGHTHGGQFNLLGLTPYAIGFERFLHPDIAPRFIAGLHDLGGAQILVSKGVGASRIPLRVGVKPEVELLTFE